MERHPGILWRGYHMKTALQKFGKFLSAMVMPNIGAFIAWGFITALFIPEGWWPNGQLAQLVGPMLTYLLPLLIAYTAGRNVAGERGGVIGAIAAVGSRHPLRQTAARRPARTVFAANSDNMQINKAEFKCSSERISQVPKDALKDIAFIGRSNVGKSSLINMLTGRQGLAKVSGTPGKTRLINHFLIDNAWYLVDLPGYGYARTSKTKRSEFSKIITDYVLKCEKMHFLFVLADLRLEPQKIDLQFIEMLGMNGIPFAVIFTKADKLSKTQREKSVERYRAALAEQWEELPRMFVSSSQHGTGREEILGFIGECLNV